MHAAMTRIMSIVIMAISCLELFFISLASYSLERLPLFTFILSWFFKIMLALLLCCASALLFISESSVINSSIFYLSSIICIIHIGVLVYTRLSPLADSGYIFYILIIIYLLVSLYFAKNTFKPS